MKILFFRQKMFIYVLHKTILSNYFFPPAFLPEARSCLALASLAASSFCFFWKARSSSSSSFLAAAGFLSGLAVPALKVRKKT